MKQYIFGFPQEIAIKFNLKINELLLLDYMYKFFSSDKVISIKENGKTYFKLTYKKILDDLPILHVKQRQVQRIIENLEKNNMLKKLETNHKCIYICPYFDKLFFKNISRLKSNCKHKILKSTNLLKPLSSSQKCPHNFSFTILRLKNLVKKDKKSSQKCLPIDSYNIKKIINIKLSNKSACVVNISAFNKLLHTALSNKFSKITYEMFFSDIFATNIDDCIKLSSLSADVINKSFLAELINIVEDVYYKVSNTTIE